MPKILSAALLFILVASCSNQAGPVQEPVEGTGSAWEALLEREPQDIRGNPIPVGEVSSIDGIYGRLDDSPPLWWRCLRCAEYRPAGGIWRMQFDRGVMRLYYEVKDWVSIVSFRIEGNRLFLSNDLICDEVGEYRWSREGDKLVLEVINDPCSFELRGNNLSRGVWELCPENQNALDAPEGCKDRATFQSFRIEDSTIKVHVHEGDARTFEIPPTIVAVANDENIASPEGVTIRYHANSVEYGVNRVLWWGGDWIEAEIEAPVNAMGVQFYGTESIGWASVLFDGEEVWRGDVSAIWNHFGSYGGYIEVTGFEPGKHLLRVELVEGDYRPLTIAIFGFSENEGVRP